MGLLTQSQDVATPISARLQHPFVRSQIAYANLVYGIDRWSFTMARKCLSHAQTTRAIGVPAAWHATVKAAIREIGGACRSGRLAAYAKARDSAAARAVLHQTNDRIRCDTTDGGSWRAQPQQGLEPWLRVAM